jgi:DNA-binding GntR family transcriptional regulator
VDVHTQLREMIVMGELAPNSVLSQAAIARTLGVSRGPVREAFRRLQEQGLITAEPDQRTYVTGFDPSSLDSLYGARITLETLGAGLTAATRTSELSAELHELIEQMDQGVE